MKRVVVNVELYIYVPAEVEERDLKDIAGWPLDKIELAGGKVLDKRFQ